MGFNWFWTGRTEFQMVPPPAPPPPNRNFEPWPEDENDDNPESEGSDFQIEFGEEVESGGSSNMSIRSEASSGSRSHQMTTSVSPSYDQHALGCHSRTGINVTPCVSVPLGIPDQPMFCLAVPKSSCHIRSDTAIQVRIANTSQSTPLHPGKENLSTPVLNAIISLADQIAWIPTKAFTECRWPDIRGHRLVCCAMNVSPSEVNHS